jgi:uncharacterized protein YecT (DUF1311 family)
MDVSMILKQQQAWIDEMRDATVQKDRPERGGAIAAG